jgi:DNA-binding MarR family transcriptional regulator
VNRQQALTWTARRAPGLSVEDAELGVLLYAGGVELVRTVEEHLRRYGLPSGQFAVLISLGSAPEGRLAPSALAERLSVSRPTITGIVDGLENAGLARRHLDPENRRSQRVALTKEGRRLLEDIAPDHFRRLAAAVSGFTPAERETLRAALALIGRFNDRLIEEEKDT